MATTTRQDLMQVGLTFHCLKRARLRWRCIKTDGEGNNNYSLVLTFVSGVKRNLHVMSDHGSKTIVVLTSPKKHLIFKMIGSPSDTKLHVVWNDGTDIGSGLNNNLPPPEDNLYFGNYQRKYQIFKRRQTVDSGEPSRILGVDIQYTHEMITEKEFVQKTMYLNILDPNIDDITLTLLVAQMIMMAVLDPGFSQLTINPMYCPIPSELQNVFNPSPEECCFRKAATLMNGLRTDFYVLSDISLQPLYIFEVSGSDCLNVLDASNLSTVLVADNITDHQALCTVTTSKNTKVGYIRNGVVKNTAGQVVLHSSRLKDTPNRVAFYDSNNVTLQTYKWAELCLHADEPQNATLKFYRDNTYPSVRALLLPYLCIVGRYFFNMNVALVRTFTSKIEVYKHIKRLS